MSSSLFTVFEPSALGGLNLNWISMICFLVIPIFLTARSSHAGALLTLISSAINSNSKETLSKVTSPVSGLVLLSLLAWVALNNFLGLGPYLFTASSHLVFGFSLALPVWLGYMAIYLVYFNKESMSHLIPSGTPLALVGLMILIETVSTLIRPGTLMFRLTANMIAGHLLIVLLSGSAVGPAFLMASLAMGGLILLLVLEVSVSFIQAYVFYLLSSLYLSDLVSSPSSLHMQVSSQVV